MSGLGWRVMGQESALRIENEMLLERVRVLEASLREPVHAPPSWRLTPSQHTILGVMLARDVASRGALEALLYGGRDAEWPGARTLNVHISHMRKLLALHGVEILTVSGRGWSLRAHDKARIRAACAHAARAPLSSEAAE